jgi:asparagine synthase (glutamine-hydrolysing)
LVVSGTCAAPTDALTRLLERIATGRESIEAVTGLGGSYHAILDDGSALVVVGDLAGLRPVFTASVGGVPMFASTPLGLAGATRTGLDAGFLAARLMCPDAVELHESSTAFSEIRRMPQGAILRCAAEGMTLIKRPPPVVQAGYDGAPGLRSALVQAVQARLTGPVSADLSGGLDSTSLAMIADSHGAQDLLAVTYLDPLACGDEDAAFARRATTLLRTGKQVVIEGGADSLPYSGIEDIDPLVFDEPSQELLLAARTRIRLAPATERTGHLGGDGGDAVLTGPLTYLVDLARRHHYRALIREATGLARLRQRPATALVRSALSHARGTYARELIRCAAKLTQSDSATPGGWRRPGIEESLACCRLSPTSAWSTPQAAHRLAERLYALALQAPALGADAMALRAIRHHADLTRQYQRLTSTWNIVSHAPFLDDSVVTACTRVPVIERTSVSAVKPLLGAAVAGLVPRAVLERRSKGDYSASEYAGLRAAGLFLCDLMAAPRLADLGLIEPARVRPVLEAAIAGAASPLGALGDLIATELWLRADPTAATYRWNGVRS